MSSILHYLRLFPPDKFHPKVWLWSCVCGRDEGSGPTEAACDNSYRRHLVKETFKRSGRLY